MKEIHRIWKKSNKILEKQEQYRDMVIYSTILEGVVKPHPQCGTLIAIKNHQIGPHNWKTVKNYEKNKSYAARA